MGLFDDDIFRKFDQFVVIVGEDLSWLLEDELIDRIDILNEEINCI